jgi:3-oxoacyl-[acyl-carrier protein] reductase
MSKLKKIIKFAINIVLPRKTTVNIGILDNNQLLAGRTAIITGGTSGIGLAIAKHFVRSGAFVIITGRSQNRIDEACNIISQETATNGLVRGLEWDNTAVEDFEVKFDEALSILPKDRKHIDILVNNAGILGGTIEKASLEDYDLIMNTNLRGTFFLSRIVCEYYKEHNIHGNVLNIASSSSIRPAESVYTISKWGIRGLTLGLARHYSRYGITVNGLAPGPTATPMLLKKDKDNLFKDIPLGRYILPEEIANFAVVLVSEMGRPIIGDILYATGGFGNVTFELSNNI